MTNRKDKGVAKSAALTTAEIYGFVLTIVSFSIPTNYWKKFFRKEGRTEARKSVKETLKLICVSMLNFYERRL